MHGEWGRDGREPWGDDAECRKMWTAWDESAWSRVLRDVTECIIGKIP